MPDTTLEVNLERRLREYLKSMGGSCTKFEAEKGLPDRIITLPGGLAMFVELKQDRGKLSPIQRARIPMLREQGGIVTVMYGEEGLAHLTYELTFWRDHCGRGGLPAKRLFNAKLAYCRNDHPEYTLDRHFPGGGI